MPETMTAVEISAPGGPEVLKPKIVPTPKPGAGPDPGQGRRGRRQPSRRGSSAWASIRRRPGHSPLPGLEIAGEVVATGAGVTRWKAGRQGVRAGQRRRLRRVLHRRGADRRCRSRPASTWSRPAAVPETFFTVWNNVFERGRLAAGEWFLVHGGIERHRHHRHPARQGVRRQGDRHRRLRRQVQGVPRARRRPGRQLQDARTSSRPSRRPPAARASTSRSTWSAATTPSATSSPPPRTAASCRSPRSAAPTSRSTSRA